MIRAVGYVRVSTAHQADEGLSLSEQERRVEAYITANGWEHVATYSERGVSGAVPFADRPAFAQLTANLSGIDRVVIPKLDRLGRSTLDLLAAIERMAEGGAAVVSLVEGIDTSTPVGKLTRTLLAAIAEFERDRLGERVAEVTAARAKKGEWHGGPRPYGYDYARSAKGESTGDGLVIVEAEAQVVRRMYAEWIAGRSQRQITRDLNSDGIRTLRGGEWAQGTVSKILRAPVYGGSLRLNGEVYDAKHEAIIDPATWRQAEQLRAASDRPGGAARGRRPTANHALAGGLLRCGICGSAMSAITKPTRTPGTVYERYTCSGRTKFGNDYCSQEPVKRDPIDAAVWRFFENVALDVDSTRAAIGQAHASKLGEIDALRHQAEAEASRAADSRARIERDYVDGRLEAEAWARLDANLGAELSAARAQADRLGAQRDAVTAEMQAIDSEAAVLEDLNALRLAITGTALEAGRESVDAFRAALRRLFSSFELMHWAVFERFGSEAEPDSSAVWHPDLRVGDRLNPLLLIPHIRDSAIEAWDGAEFPALRRAALTLRSFDANSLTT